MPSQVNEIRRDLASSLSLNPWIAFDSSPRAQMYSSHLGQKLVIAGATEKYCQTGMEIEYGKYTFSVKMPCDGTIIRTIERFKKTIDKDSINLNPQTVVIYEDDRTKEVGIFNLALYCSYHQYFGFEYKAKPAINSLVRGVHIPKDTIFLDSPGVTDQGVYKYGVELNMAFMSHPSVSEDGVMICRDVLDKFKFKTYEIRVADWGSSRFPLNLYGTVDNYKAFPDIGDYVRDDGLLMAMRGYEKSLAPVEQSIYDVMEPDYISDKGIYANGPGGRIVDIRVHTADSSFFENSGTIDTQVNKYLLATREFHQKIVNEWRRLRKERGDALSVSDAFHRQVVESLVYIGEENETPKITKIYRKNPLDDYRVEFVIEYEITPREGFKFTDEHGGKGVVCKIAEPHEMPVDEAGNRADIVMDGNSTVNRMNMGRLYEQYTNAASRDVAKWIREKIGIAQGDHHAQSKVEEIFYSNRELFDRCYSYLMGYYSIVCPRMFTWMNVEANDEQKIEHLASVVKTHVYLYLPLENEVEQTEVVKQLETHYRPTYGPVTYVGESGQKITTVDPIRIGSMYIMLLEKTAENDLSAVSSAKLQHFGILAQLTKNDKYSQPTRNQPVKGIGESEARIFTSYAGERAIAELMDRNNTPATHKEIVWNLLNADKPTNIKSVIDRKKIPLGGSKPLNIVDHALLCAGVKFVFHGDQ